MPAKIEGQKLKELFFEEGEETVMEETEGQTICRLADNTKRVLYYKHFWMR